MEGEPPFERHLGQHCAAAPTAMSEAKPHRSIPLDDFAAFISKDQIRLFSLNGADHYRTHCSGCDSELVQERGDSPTLTCRSCQKRFLLVSRSKVDDGACADPQFELQEAPDDAFVDDDSCLSIGGPGSIDVESSDGVLRTVSGGTHAHESIILRTRSSRISSSESAAGASSESPSSEAAIDDALCSKFLVKATSAAIRTGLAAEVGSAAPPTGSASDAAADADADQVLEYLRSFTANDDPHSHLPFLHTPSKPLPVQAVRAVVLRAQQLFAQEPRVLAVPDDVRVFSDIHGNFKDLLIWQRLFWPDGVAGVQGSVLWLGDYVDRGHNSVEVLLYMLSQKVKNPSKWLMLRGNHEARLMNGWVEQYGDGSFQYLCAATERAAGLKPKELWSEFNNVFDYLPLAAVIQGSIFAVHGGLPRRCTWDEGDSGAAALVDASTAPVASSAPSDSALPTHAASAPARAPIEVLLDTLPRPWSGENPNDASNKACTAGYDMLWADPVQGWVDHQFAEHIPNGEFIAAGSHDAIFDRSVTSFGLSVWRACKPRIFGFANAALDHFLERNGYCGILRGHMGKQSGVQIAKCGRVLTVFSTSSDHHQSSQANLHLMQ